MTRSTHSVFFKMDNVIQHYAWGSRTSLRDLFGIANPDNQPQAEIWMGAHPNGCSHLDLDGRPVRLAELIAREPQNVLGQRTAASFNELPYLFKVLAADSALSIQVHPSKAQAEAGFAKESRAGIPLDAANRNYKDPNHKPELVFALTPYQAMNGFRPIPEIVSLFQSLAIDELGELVTALETEQSEAGLQRFFSAMLTLDGQRKDAALDKLLAATKNRSEPLYSLITELSALYPGDIGLFAPLMLNVLTLQPGEAMYLDACTPHAYLKGTGLEIMASSDNVLRAGLTPKHIDVEELVADTRFVAKDPATLRLEPHCPAPHTAHYPVPVPDFKFSVYHQPEAQPVEIDSAEILFAIDAPLTLNHVSGESLTIGTGESVFVPASSSGYQLSSTGRVARAYN